MRDSAKHLLPLSVEETICEGQTLDIHQLRDRGWTRQMVSRFLVSPDARRPSTHGGGRPAELFALARVREAERTLAFSAARRSAFERSALVRRSQDARRASLLRFATNIDLKLPDQDLEQVYRASRSATISFPPGCPNDDLTRAVCWLLSILAPASIKLDVFQGQPGIRDARALLLGRKLNLIALSYPPLAGACARFRFAPDHDN